MSKSDTAEQIVEKLNGQTVKLCPICKGNDGNMPCAYPSEGRKGCLRDERLWLNKKLDLDKISN